LSREESDSFYKVDIVVLVVKRKEFVHQKNEGEKGRHGR
jgi:hypothetical protein